MKRINQLLNKEEDLEWELKRCKEQVFFFRVQARKMRANKKVANGMLKKIQHFQ